MADRALLERLSRALTEQGLLIEAGWVGYRLAVISPDAPAIQLEAGISWHISPKEERALHQ